MGIRTNTHTYMGSVAGRKGAELHIQANAASDPNGNETDATTGWTGFGLTGTGANVFESQGGTKNVGSYALHTDADDTPTNAARVVKDIQTDFPLVAGKIYLMSVDAAHIGGAGGPWIITFASDVGLTTNKTTIATLENTDTTFATFTLQFTHTANHRYFGFVETDDDGGVYVDNISCREVFP